MYEEQSHFFCSTARQNNGSLSSGVVYLASAMHLDCSLGVN